MLRFQLKKKVNFKKIESLGFVTQNQEVWTFDVWERKDNRMVSIGRCVISSDRKVTITGCKKAIKWMCKVFSEVLEKDVEEY